MSNQIDSLIPRIVARGLLSLRSKAVMPRLVNAEFGAEAAKRGDIIDVPLSQAIIAQDVEPSHTAPQPPDTEMQSVKIELNRWQKASFHLSDKEMDQIEANESFVPLQMAEAVGALARAVNQSIIDVMHDSAAKTGAFMKPAFARAAQDTLSLDDHQGLQPVIDARRSLNGAFAPKSNRNCVINFDGEANLLALTNGLDLTKAGDSSFGLEGEIGRRLGFDFFATDTLEKDADEAFVGVATTAKSASGRKISVSLKSGAPKVGKYVSTEGHDDKSYRISGATGSGSAVEITIDGSLQNAIAKGDYVSHVEGRTMGFAFHRDAVALAMRPLSSTGMTTGHNGQMMTITDPESGLSLRLEVTRQYKQTVWEFDLLWGVALIKPEFVVRIQGR